MFVSNFSGIHPKYHQIQSENKRLKIIHDMVESIKLTLSAWTSELQMHVITCNWQGENGFPHD
jgi:hypothetical protein